MRCQVVDGLLVALSPFLTRLRDQLAFDISGRQHVIGAPRSILPLQHDPLDLFVLETYFGFRHVQRPVPKARELVALRLLFALPCLLIGIVEEHYAVVRQLAAPIVHLVVLSFAFGRVVRFLFVRRVDDVAAPERLMKVRQPVMEQREFVQDKHEAAADQNR